MRQYKFRGQRTDTKEWVCGYVVKIHDGRVFIIPENSGCFRKSPYIPYKYEVLPESVGQWTGDYDKDGTEIYEGDVLLYKYHRDRSGTDIAEFTDVIEWDGQFDNYSGFSINKKMEKTVIGSIHTHPELKEKV